MSKKYVIVRTQHNEHHITITQQDDVCLAVVSEVGEPYARLSVKTDIDPPAGCFWVKAWSENEHLVKQLVESGQMKLEGPKMKISQHVYTQAAQLVSEAEGK